MKFPLIYSLQLKFFIRDLEPSYHTRILKFQMYL